MCGAEGQQEVFYSSWQLEQMHYVTTESEIHIPETSATHEMRGPMTCSDDQLTLVGPDKARGGGTWDRATGSFREAIADLMEIDCSDYWVACRGEPFGYLSCSASQTCAYGSCDSDQCMHF